MHISLERLRNSLHCAVLHADNWKVCSSPECPGNPTSVRTASKPKKDKDCTLPPWRNGAGVGGVGVVEVGFKGKNPDYECGTAAGDCWGACSTVFGICPTSSCIANSLGEHACSAAQRQLQHSGSCSTAAAASRSHACLHCMSFSGIMHCTDSACRICQCTLPLPAHAWSGHTITRGSY
jgi:hypothetical protein